MKKLVFFTMAILMSIPIYAQRNDNADYWNRWEYTPKEGMRVDDKFGCFVIKYPIK